MKHEFQDPKAVRAWCLYDWANSAFATTVMAAMYPPFFRGLAIAAGVEESRATAYWGYTSALALVIIALASPIMGAAADSQGTRKRFLAVFIGLGVVATAAFVCNGETTWILAAGLYIVANIGFAGANVFYESLLPTIVRQRELDWVSSRGYAIGYLGGGLLLVVNAAWVIKPELFGIASAAVAIRLSFLSVAIWWGVFSIPILRHVPEPPGSGVTEAHQALLEGLRRLRTTAREVRRYRQLTIFLVAFWIYNDGISTIIKMATAYGDEIGIGMSHLIGALVITQFVGLPFSLLFGRLAARVGAKTSIQIALAAYSAICVGGFFMQTPLHFYVLATSVGMVQGGSQALSRSLFAAMVPRHRSAEFFGFFSASAKMAGIAGPLVFGITAHLTGQG
ncbi:MAG: MFS transporter, partial [bacterium]|nr:MFS transporter [bacterium]